MSSSLKLDWCSHDAAAYAVRRWHYSRSLPTPPLVKVGAWENGVYIGCILFSRGANKNLGRPFGLDQTELAELTRVALSSHRAPVSRILAVALRMVRRSYPTLRLLVSFADPHHGHHGGIYQASGWLYLGTTAPSFEYIGPDGKRWHPRMISPSGSKPAYGRRYIVWRPDQCTINPLPGKHKYVLPLDDAIRAQIVPFCKPYPKRAGSIEDVPADQAGEGGSQPTPALHA